MKRSKWLVIALVVVVLLAAGVYLYFSNGASADVLLNKNTLTCKSKFVTDKVLFVLSDADQAYLGQKKVKLNIKENGDDQGIFVREGNKIYFTDGMKYSSAANVPSGLKVLTFGGVYYGVYESTATDISKIILTKTQALVAYKEYAYIIDTASYNKVGDGFIYQSKGTTKVCASPLSYEIDVAKKGYRILGNSDVKDTAVTEATKVVEEFMRLFTISLEEGKYNGTEAKSALDLLTDSLKQTTLTNSPYSASGGMAMLVGVQDGHSSHKFVSAEKNKDGTVTVVWSLDFAGSEHLVHFNLTLEKNIWKIASTDESATPLPDHDQ